MIIVYGLICLSIVVFVHEFGHFITAKLAGIEVERFSIGMGKRLFGFSLKGTDYCISLFPIGGYCKMKGEDAFMQAFGRGEATVGKEKGSFFAAHPLKRIAVSFMGPLFNILFSIVALAIVWAVGFSYQVSSSRILLSSEYPELDAGDTMASPHPADRAGLKSGDIILSIDGKATASYDVIQEIVYQNPEKSLKVMVDRNGERLELTMVPALDKKRAIGRIGIYAWDEPVVAEVEKGGPAALAGLQPGDTITRIDGKPVASSLDVERALASGPASLALEVLRSGQTKALTLNPAYAQKEGGPKRASVGFGYKRPSYHSPRLSLFGAIGKGFSETAKNLSLTLRSVGLLFKKVDLTEALAGPARITYMMGSVAQSSFSQGISNGITSVFNLLSIISISLFLTNLLPIPILDGGMIIMFLIEMLRKKPLRPSTVYKMTMVGFVIIAAIFIFATYNDILFFAFKR
jgi:regulator of sigma E protease